MATNDEIAKELADYMRSIGWSQTKADTQSRMWFDFLAPRIRKQEAEKKSD